MSKVYTSHSTIVWVILTIVFIFCGMYVVNHTFEVGFQAGKEAGIQRYKDYMSIEGMAKSCDAMSEAAEQDAAEKHIKYDRFDGACTNLHEVAKKVLNAR